ncbi:PBPe domain-containing protein [Caenorhabditis elegans]|uniref:NMDA-type ionotropic glutamate receptor NMR-2 n=2 Tax=Caenorhabditis elegans TaxID=6239 RepID=G5EEH3_CAEEL|nr:PBPe domain-containing protein [Caenorhabditis elegans]AAK01102.2 NMDA-type ionotropic glutamate receptor NMR-2 [Caenorhabditis elegans]CAB01667.4 PBPe domain-containing protein [Caenorhabditis elegans]|eukprot:NP_001256640.1 NMDA class glutamate Receptor [Caenorhabditis elegans]
MKHRIWFILLLLATFFEKNQSIDLGGSRKVQKPKEDPKREDVNIAVVYQHYAGRSKSYDKAFKEVIRKINDATAVSSLRRLATRYNFQAVDCILPTGTFFVKEVLDCLCNNVTSNNVALIIFVTASETYDSTTAAEQYFLTAASYTGIPIIAWNADNAGFTFENDLGPYRIIQMAPPIEHQARAMLALLRRYNWPKFGVVTSEMAGNDRFVTAIREELELFSNKSTKFEMIHFSHMNTKNDTDVDLKLADVKKNQAKIILLYANAAQAGTIFSHAEKMDMIGEKYLWIGTQSVKGTQTTVKAPAQAGMLCVNFHTVSNAMFAPRDDILPLIIQLAPKLFGAALLQLRPNEMFSLKSNVSCKSEDGDPYWDNGKYIYEHMKAAFVKGNPFHVDDGHDSFFYTFEKTGRLRNSILQISNLRTNSKGEKTWEKVGIFTNNELKMADVQWPGEKANPPQGAADKFHVKVVTLHEPPFIAVSDVDPDTQKCPGNQGSICDWGDVEYTDGAGVKKNRTLLKCCSGYCVDLLNKLANDIGFTYTLYKVRDEKWGLKTENGWNGLIADLMHNKADMCVTSLKLNSERARDIDFSLPFLDTGISIIVKIRSGVLSPTAFLEPFEYSTWVIILFVCIHVAAISIFLFEWVSPYSFNMQKYPPPEHKFSLFRSYWLVWATLFSASVSTDVPKSTVSRLMALVWAAFGLTFLAVYTANLAAFMITRVQYYDLSGIHDPMLNFPHDQKPPFRFGTVDGGNTHETMKRNWHKMHEYVKHNKYFRMNISAGIEAVKNEELDAFIYDAVVLDYWAGKDANCALMTVGKWASMTGYGIGFPKNSPHTSLVNHYMLQYQQKGDLERLQNFWLTGACTPDSHSQTQSAPLGIENFLSAFVLLAGGIIVSVIVLGFEHIYCMHLRKPLQKIDPNGWCGIISMAMGKSLTFTEAVDRVQEWRSRTQSLASTNSPQLKRRRSANLRPTEEPFNQDLNPPRRSPRFLQVETNL